MAELQQNVGVLQEGEELEEDTPKEISEDRHAALARWWLENNRPFSIWFLTTLPDDEARRKVLLEAAPHMPRQPSTARDKKSQGGEELATDWLLPELSQDGLLAGGGKLLVLLFARRFVKTNGETSCCMLQDLKLLNDLNMSGLLPQLDQGALDEIVKQGIAFVDQLGDPSESIQLMPNSASIDVKQAVVDRLSNGTLVEARVFLALRMRRETMLGFFCKLVEQFEAASSSSSPSSSSSSNPRAQQQRQQSKPKSRQSKPAAGTADEESKARAALAAARDELKKSVAAVENALAGGVRFADALEEQRTERRRVKAELKRGLLVEGIVS